MTAIVKKLVFQNDVFHDWDKVMNDVEELCKVEDPEQTPFESKYKAIALMVAYQNELQKNIDQALNCSNLDNSLPQETQQNVAHQLSLIEKEEILDLIAVLDARIGVLHVETEDRPSGDRSLQKGIQRLLEAKNHHRYQHCATLLDALNQLGILWSHRGEIAKAEDTLHQAYDLYYSLKHKFDPTEASAQPHLVHSTPSQNDNTASDPHAGIPDTEVPQSNNNTSNSHVHIDLKQTKSAISSKSVESVFTHTLFYLAQVYKHKQQENKSALYCLLTLERQFQMNEFEAEEWSTNALHLSEFYISKQHFKHAMQCLLASERMLQIEDFKTKLPLKYEESLPNLFLGWGKFYSARLNSSAKREKPIQRDGHHTGNDAESIAFKSIPLVDDSDPALSWATEPIFNFDTARKYFLKSMEYLNKAKAFYVLDGYVSTHWEILQEMGNLYLDLITFEDSMKRKCQMHKRRANLLEPIVTQLNPQHYQPILLQSCFTLGEIYNQMLDIKAIQMETSGKSAKNIEKHNKLIMKSIKYFRMYFKMLEVKGQQPEVIEPEQLEAWVIGHLSVARLLSRIITNDPRSKAKNLQESLKEHQIVVEYDKKHNIPVLRTEVEISSEMVQLLPPKIAALLNQLD